MEPLADPAQMADEWLKQTFTDEPAFVDAMKQVMLDSREVVVDYMMPLGLHHIFAGNHHYGPEPWYDVPGARRDWMPPYYHRADKEGLGFDRTSRGSDAVAQYPDSLWPSLRRPVDLSGEVPPLVPSRPLGLQDEERTHVLGRALPQVR